jgi:hypothetical protein
MTRSILCGLLALISVGALGVVPIACQSGGVGDPCTPEAEYDTTFAGFKVGQDFIESRSFQCSTRVCLVNHFQGRVSCPFGQPANVKDCNGEGDTSCGDGFECRASQTFGDTCDCDPNVEGDCRKECGDIDGVVCDPKLKICTCTQTPPPINGTQYYCGLADPTCKGMLCTKVLKRFTCHKPGNCQTSDPKDDSNLGKDCCVPGTDTPVTVPVCAQCNSESHRNAADAVYCSCRCCPKCCNELTPDEVKAGTPCADDQCGSKCDPNFNYCSCPTGFTCSEIRKFVGLGDPNLSGSYCIKEGTKFVSESSCGNGLKGYIDPLECKGAAAANVGTDGGT